MQRYKGLTNRVPGSYSRGASTRIIDLRISRFLEGTKHFRGSGAHTR